MSLNVYNPPDVPVHVRLALGDEAAFNRIYKANRKNLFNVAYGILKCSETSDEVVQEIFAKFWSIRSRLCNVDNVNAFLFTMTRNRALSVIKEWGRQREAHEMLGNLLAGSAVRTPEDVYVNAECYTVFDAIMNTKLSKREREVFRLSREEHLTHQEIAQVLNISPNTVSNHIKNALRIFKSQM